VSMANDGQQAIEQALALRPDTIVLDLVMPVKSGAEAAQEIRKRPELRETRIVAASASVLQADREKSRLAGCDAFLPKPIKLASRFASAEIVSFVEQFMTEEHNAHR